MKDKKFIALSGLFFLLFFVAIAALSLQQPTSGILRAKNSTPSPLKSFVLVFPQVAVAGDPNGPVKGTKIKVSVFIRDVNGNVLPQRSVRLSSVPPVTITPQDTQPTNDLGMAQFFLSSVNPGTFQLTASDVLTNSNVVNVPTVEFTQ